LTPPSSPLISVLLSVKNGMPHFPGAVRSVLKQTERDFELLLMDDGSTDGTAGAIERFAREDARVRMFRHSKPLGLTRSLNELLAEARGVYIARQDSDDMSARRRFEFQRRFLDQHPTLLAAICSYWYITEAGRPVCVQRLPADPVELRAFLERTNKACHGTFFFRAEALRKLGGYREDFPLSQDYELLLRAFKNGEVACLREPLYGFRLSPDSLTFRNPLRQKAYLDKARHIHLGGPAPARFDFDPAPPRLAEAAYAVRVGTMFLSKGRVLHARPFLRKAFSLQPFSRHNAFWFALSLLPRGVLAKLRSMKSSLDSNEY